MTHHTPTETLRDLWVDQDVTVASIATTLGVSRATVLRHAAKLGLPPRRPQRTARRPRAEVAAERARMQAQLAELWADPTLPVADIAATLGVDRETMLRWATKMGLPLTRRPHRRPRVRTARKDAWQARLPALWADPTVTIPQIAATLGLARGTVSRAAAEMGLPERPRGRRRARSG